MTGRIVIGLILSLLLILPSTGQAVANQRGAVWLLVDEASSTLRVYRGEREIERFHPISVGRRGVSQARLRGDMKTPAGEFRINWINRDSHFNIFLGLDYPNLDNARQALQSGVFSEVEFDRYLAYYRRHGAPPQDTVLGSNIGIHGLGKADPSIHEQFNWTEGCVAVTNAQIERLADLVQLGTRVIIR
ncbi:L,D-transpeptidase family protein [Modicisalibacter radicis]|uniref:L,D-transpeptidase family protein n=1 Tax=Halomonas sp. EAR18 TaxID=2518972 RepID=UPI00109D6509|nr:L,D-transpeptidase [Halomonas sp. EAR18]